MFQGSMVAIVTPMNSDGSLDIKSFKGLLDYHIECKSDGVVVVGTSGEAPTMDVDEHTFLIQEAVKHIDGKIPVIAGSGANSTKEAIFLTKKSKELGADACLLITPYYNKPNQRGMYEHFKAINDSVDIPQILYNVPSRTACDLRPETVMRLADHPNIVGIKEALDDVARLSELMAIADSQIDTKYFSVLSGDDPSFNSFMANGGDGVISVAANIIPSQISQICSLNLTKQFADASELNSIYTNIFELLFVESNPIPVKWMLQRMERIGSGIRLPLVPFSKDFHEKTINEMIKLKLL